MSIRMPEILGHHEWVRGEGLKHLHELHVEGMQVSEDDALKISPTWMLVGGANHMIFGTPWQSHAELAAYVVTLGRSMRDSDIDMYSVVACVEVMSVPRHKATRDTKGERCIIVVSRSKTEQFVTRFGISSGGRLMERDDWDAEMMRQRGGWLSTNLLVEDPADLVAELAAHQRHEDAHALKDIHKLEISSAEATWMLQAVQKVLTEFVNERRDETMGEGVGYRFGDDVGITVVLTGLDHVNRQKRCLMATTEDAEEVMKTFADMVRQGPARKKEVSADDV